MSTNCWCWQSTCGGVCCGVSGSSVVACGLSNGGGGCERMPYVIKNPSARKELTFWPCSQARNPGGLRLRRAISLIDGFTWFGGGVVLTTSRWVVRPIEPDRFPLFCKTLFSSSATSSLPPRTPFPLPTAARPRLRVLSPAALLSGRSWCVQTQSNKQTQ